MDLYAQGQEEANFRQLWLIHDVKGTLKHARSVPTALETCNRSFAIAGILDNNIRLKRTVQDGGCGPVEVAYKGFTSGNEFGGDAARKICRM